MGIDIAHAFKQKMVRNREKYPAEEFKGIYGYDDPEIQARRPSE